MDSTYFLSALGLGMALLLIPAQAARNAPEKQADWSAQEEKAPAVHVERDHDEPGADMDVDTDMETRMLSEPQVDIDADRDRARYER